MSLGVFFFTLKAPSRPLELIVYNTEARSVNLKWRRPSIPNGDIASYEIIVVQGKDVNPSTLTRSVVKETVSGDILDYEVSGLIQRSQYSVWVTAVNIRRSDKARLRSPPSRVIIFATKEEG